MGIKMADVIAAIGRDTRRDTQPGCIRTTIPLWYPGDGSDVSGQPPRQEVQVELIAVRAANSIVIDYDYDRDGYRIRMPKPDDADALVEVAFVHAWASGEPRDG